MKTKLLTIAMMASLMLTAMTKVQAQNFEGPCLPSSHGLSGHQSAFCGSILTQTIALSAGWNWFSTYIELDPVELLEMLEAELGDNAIQIKSQTQATAWDEDEEEWSGRLQNTGLTSDKTYMIQMVDGASVTVTLVGPASTPDSYTIEINSGWNWIGFPSAVSISINEALINFDAVEGDQLKTKTQASAWDVDEEEWSGGLKTLIPGQGYMYYSNSTQPKLLIFSTTAEGKSVLLRKQKE